MNIKRLFPIGRVRGVEVYAHWSALLLAAFPLLGAIRQPAVAICALFSLAGVMLIHEVGHTVAAQRCGCAVLSIELYPIHGITRFEAPWTRFEECLIAWGGCVAQFVVAAPLIAWVLLFGYTSIRAIDAVLALLGFYNAAVAIFNLLPIPGLDGSRAWYLVPLLIQRWTGKLRSRGYSPKPPKRYLTRVK